MKKFEQNVVDEILSKYDAGLSITSLNKEYHTTKIRDLLIENNRSVPESRKGIGGAKRKYSLNENYFEKLDSKDKAYFLGFIYADGFITKRSQGQNILGLTLAEIEPIDKFRKYIQTNKKVGYYKKTNSYSNESYEYKLALISDKLVSDIEKLGVVERKTFLIQFPEMDESLVPHFIRGYFDGDGSIYYTHPRSNYPEEVQLGINICGTLEFLSSIVQKVPFFNSNNIYKELRRTTDCWSIKINSNIRCLEFYHYLYKDCSDLYLSRKRNKFEDFIKERGSTTIIANPINKQYLDYCYLED